MSKKRRAIMHVETADGPVFTGLFVMRDTHGIPLVWVMRDLVSQGTLFSIPHFIRDAKAAGWSKDKIRAELREAWTEMLPKADMAALVQLAEVFLCTPKPSNT